MSYFNMVCDSCGREVYGCNIVNGMKFCAKCYQETFGETDKDRKIAELEKQLAITEKALELAVDDKCYAENCIAESFIGKGAKVAVPKKEQWYLKQAEKEIKGE